MNSLFSVFRKLPALGKIFFYFLIFYLALQNLIFFDYCAQRMIFPLIIALLALFTGFPVRVFEKKIESKHKIAALILAVPILYIFLYYFVGIRDPFFTAKYYVKGPIKLLIFISVLLADFFLAYWVGLVLSFSLYDKCKVSILALRSSGDIPLSKASLTVKSKSANFLSV